MFENSIVVEKGDEIIYHIFNPVYFEKLRRTLGMDVKKKIIAAEAVVLRDESDKRAWYCFVFKDGKELDIPLMEYFMGELHVPVEQEPACENCGKTGVLPEDKICKDCVPIRENALKIHAKRKEMIQQGKRDEIAKAAESEENFEEFAKEQMKKATEELEEHHAQEVATNEPDDTEVPDTSTTLTIIDETGDVPENVPMPKLGPNDSIILPVKGTYYDKVIKIAYNLEQEFGKFSRTDIVLALRNEFQAGLDVATNDFNHLVEKGAFVFGEEVGGFIVHPDWIVPETGEEMVPEDTETELESSDDMPMDGFSRPTVVLQGIADRADSDSILQAVNVDFPGTTRDELNELVSRLSDEGYIDSTEVYPVITKKGSKVLDNLQRTHDEPEPDMEICSDCGDVPGVGKRMFIDKVLYCADCASKKEGDRQEPEDIKEDTKEKNEKPKSLMDLAEGFY